jgi:hypothetical protein
MIGAVFLVVYPRLAVLARGEGADYREILLRIKLRSVHDYPDLPANYRESARELREIYTRAARSMPEGEEGECLLADACEYFEGDFIDVWISCRSSSQILAWDGIQVDPLTILKGALTVVKTLGVVPQKQYKFRYFGALYEGRRREGMSHADTLSKLIELRKF